MLSFRVQENGFKNFTGTHNYANYEIQEIFADLIICCTTTIIIHTCTYISRKLRLTKFYISNLYRIREKFYIITSKVKMNLFV